MTDEQINQRIAESCGWAHARIEPHAYPNYCGCLNAMHEAEKVLTFKQIAVYCDLLTPPEYGVWWKINTTARQRAEDFLKTLGKWDANTEDSSVVRATDKDSLTVVKEAK